MLPAPALATDANRTRRKTAFATLRALLAGFARGDIELEFRRCGDAAFGILLLVLDREFLEIQAERFDEPLFCTLVTSTSSKV